MSLVKLIHYPPTPAGEAGVNAHHDAGFLTLLWQHGVAGLQVENQDGDWIDVPADGDAIVVNLGEMLQSVTGNYFVATNHRVITADERYSSGYFHGPALTTSLAPLPLDERFAQAVAASPRHRDTGFMARRDELLAGAAGTSSASAETYGLQLWNYFTRSYPELVRRHHPGLVTAE
jgi:isopenicillin N synthase-like dioxygenase